MKFLQSFLLLFSIFSLIFRFFIELYRILSKNTEHFSIESNKNAKQHIIKQRKKTARLFTPAEFLRRYVFCVFYLEILKALQIPCDRF